MRFCREGLILSIVSYFLRTVSDVQSTSSPSVLALVNLHIGLGEVDLLWKNFDYV